MNNMFVILAHQRSGTHLLASLLNSHPDLRCYGEVSLSHRRKTLPLGWKNLYKLGKNEGCILMYTHFLRKESKNKNFIKFIKKAKIIHLTRINTKNHLKSLFKKRNAKFETKKAKVVQKSIESYKKRVFKHNFKHVFNITYEEICNDNNITEYENPKLLNFLGVKPRKLTTKLDKGVDHYSVKLL